MDLVVKKMPPAGDRRRGAIVSHARARQNDFLGMSICPEAVQSGAPGPFEEPAPEQRSDGNVVLDGGLLTGR
ncbi:hypothetical protein RSPO_c00056 [Ralstonia solanacearum Po82]|uniref:Uncharacterized protein n=1 Tax=Ralstonia solanacearum (strain Po82) TaxID=1031711 RepID=F6G5U4_RALS8|nr:hypothetical protein RSPO_c00056 [Ralstonia solanacearum Po82]